MSLDIYQRVYFVYFSEMLFRIRLESGYHFLQYFECAKAKVKVQCLVMVYCNLCFEESY